MLFEASAKAHSRVIPPRIVSRSETFSVGLVAQPGDVTIPGSGDEALQMCAQNMISSRRLLSWRINLVGSLSQQQSKPVWMLTNAALQINK
jgi:hypothetical protein